MENTRKDKIRVVVLKYLIWLDHDIPLFGQRKCVCESWFSGQQI